MFSPHRWIVWLQGPELLWIVLYILCHLAAALNRPNSLSGNARLESLWLLLPLAGVPLSFLCFAVPGAVGGWWMLAPVALSVLPKMPENYRTVALNPAFAAKRNESAYWLYDNPERIIRETRFPLEDGQYAGANWRETFLAIGQSAFGDLYLLDIALADSPVYLLSHEDHTLTEEFASLEEYLDYWRGEVALAERSEPERACAHARTQREAVIALAVIALSILLIIVMLILGLIYHRK
jgi:hypothetical protein